MFRIKLILSYVAKHCENKLSSRIGVLGCIANGKSPCRLLSHQIFSFNSTEINGFQKFLAIHKNLELNGNKNQFSRISDEKCWKCHQYLELKKFSCALCGALQKPKENINYFELFGITQSFDVDLEALSSKFKNLQKAFHPDKFVNKSKDELEISEMHSRVINKAYSVLKDPLARGFYILELNKIPLESSFPVGQEFLIAIMERNEELESIKTESNLNKFLKINNELMDQQINKVGAALQHNKWNEAKINLLKLNYYVNLDTKIKGKQTDFYTKKS